MIIALTLQESTREGYQDMYPGNHRGFAGTTEEEGFQIRLVRLFPLLCDTTLTK
jgi:hypothetical protein